jgi:hypothetical protein
MQLPVRLRCVLAPTRRAQSERESLETLQSLRLFLNHYLSEMAGNAMDRKSQLPEWRQKRLSRLLHLYTADGVPNC